MKLEYRLIVDWVAQDSSILDLGCGDGELLQSLVQEKKVRGQGIEADEQAVYKCVAKGLSVFHEDIDSGLSGYPDSSFDYVVLNQSLQQVKKPDFVLNEALRVGKNLVVGFPNFCHYPARVQILFGGRVPLTPALPYEWYNTPNLHFLSISDFTRYCKVRKLRIKDSNFISKNKRVRLLPNLMAETGLFLLSK